MRLIVVEGPWKGAEIDLEGEVVRVGRDPECEIALPDTAMSRLHFALRRHEDGWVLEDLESRNGTAVNGIALSRPHPLRRGDRIAAGRSAMVYDVESRLIAAELRATTMTVHVGDRLDPLGALFRLSEGLAGVDDLELFASRLAAALSARTRAAWVRVYRPHGDELVQWPGPWDAGAAGHGDLELPAEAASAIEAGDVAWVRDSEIIAVPVGTPPFVVLVLEGCGAVSEDDLRFCACAGQMAATLHRQARHLGDLVTAGRAREALIAASPAMIAVRELVERAGPTDSTVLIRGESGSGKEVVAEALHRASRRSDGPFVAVNCAAIPGSLLEAELFGHEKGAFTGAEARRAGHFEVADGGTLFLDEIGELPPAAQSSILRAVEERAFRPVGGSEPIEVDVRIVAATHRNLEAAVSAGDFRQDLFFRLSVLNIEVPPLRERPEDIEALAHHFVAAHARRADRRVIGITDEALEALLSHPWPGNVRQLRNVIERAVILGSGERIEIEDLGPELAGGRAEPRAPGSFVKLPMRLAELERRAVMAALQASGGNKSQAARILGVDRVTIYNKLKAYSAGDD